MVTINKLSEKTTLKAGDKFPIYSEEDGDARKINATNVAKFMQDGFVKVADANDFTAQQTMTGGLVIQNVSETRLNDVTDPINTTDKVEGKIVADTTNNKIRVATGSAASDTWATWPDASSYTGPMVYRRKLSATDVGANYDLDADDITTTEQTGTIGSITVTNPSSTEPLLVQVNLDAYFVIVQASDAETVSVTSRTYLDTGDGSLDKVIDVDMVRYQNHTTSPTTRTPQNYYYGYNDYLTSVPAGGSITVRVQVGLLYTSSADATAAAGNSGYSSGNEVTSRIQMNMYGITTGNTVTDL